MYKIVLSIVIMSYSMALSAQSQIPRIMIYSETAGYKHKSIPAGIKAIQKLGKEFNFTADTTSDSRFFSTDKLESYDAVVFLNTSGDMLDSLEQVKFELYIRKGGAYVGIHGASASEYGWPWYGKLVGAIFDGHPQIQPAAFEVKDNGNPAVAHLPKLWKIEEELYNFKSISDKISVILTVDESSYEGGTNGAYHPMAWYQEFDGGRSFYTALGHADERYQDPLFLKHILEGIRFAIGERVFPRHARP